MAPMTPALPSSAPDLELQTHIEVLDRAIAGDKSAIADVPNHLRLYRAVLEECIHHRHRAKAVKTEVAKPDGTGSQVTPAVSSGGLNPAPAAPADPAAVSAPPHADPQATPGTGG